MGRYANFYNSKNKDRVYDAESMSEWLRPFFKNGVFNGGLKVTADSEMNISVGTGYAYIDGKNKFFDVVTTLTVEAAHSTLKRIDNVVVRRNDTERDFTILIQKGGFSSEPVAPEPVRREGVYDLVLAQIFVDAAAVSIRNINIEDTRMNESLCGWVVSTVDDIDFEQIFTQMNDFKLLKTQEFNEWFSQLQNVIDENAAGNLLNKITELSNRIQSLNQDLSSSMQNVNSKLVSATSAETGFVKPGQTLKVDSSGILEVNRTVKTITLLASSWANGVYTIRDSLITSTSKQTVMPVIISNPPTQEEKTYLENLSNAGVVAGSQQTGLMYLIASGDTPTVDLNIMVLFER